MSARLRCKTQRHESEVNWTNLADVTTLKQGSVIIIIVNLAIDPPEITDISNNQTMNEGDVLALHCTAYGDPTPKITWTRVSDNSVVKFPLTISGKQDEGAYKCTADNGVGNAANRTVNVFVQSESVSLCYLCKC